MSSEPRAAGNTAPEKQTTDRQSLFKDLANRFGVRGVEENRPDQAYIRVDRDDAIALLSYLQNISGYTHLSFFTAVDRIEDGTFDLLYMLHSYAANHDLGVFVEIPREGEGCAMDSIHHLWPAGETYQRELREMFGVDFPGSPRLGEDFALEGWEDLPPMRRDFDTREYSERVYYVRPGRQTQDTREHMKERLYPSEAETW